MVAENLEIGNQGEIMKLLGSRWRTLSAEERAPFEATAAELLTGFRTELAAWKILHPDPVKPVKVASAVAVPAPPSGAVDPDGWTIAMDEARKEQCVKSNQAHAPFVIPADLCLTFGLARAGTGGTRRRPFRRGRTR